MKLVADDVQSVVIPGAGHWSPRGARGAAGGADAVRARGSALHAGAADPAAVLSTQGLQTCGPLELDLGERIGSL